MQPTVKGALPSATAGLSARRTPAGASPLAAVAALAATLLAAYAGVVGTLVRQWWSSDQYSYGFLIPGISAYLIWIRRDRLARLAPAPGGAAGWLVLAGGLALLAVGHAGGVLVLAEASLLVSLAGAVRLALGPAFLRAVAFPIAYLAFMIPVAETSSGRLHYPLQLIAARVATALLQAAGVPAYREASFIALPHTLVDVAAACSGVNYLISVAAVGVPLAYLFLDGWLRRALLVGFGLAIALLGNGLRVALVGLLANYRIGESAHGPFHILQGLSVAVLGYLALFAGLALLSRTGRGRTTARTEAGVAPPEATPRPARAFRVPAAAGSLLALLAAGYVHLYVPPPVPPARDLERLPTEIGGWTGTAAPPVYPGYRGLGLDQELSRSYRAASGDAVHLYVGYLSSQSQGRELVGSRTGDLAAGDSPFVVPTADGGALAAAWRVLEGEGGRKLVVFWYDLNGRVVSDIIRAKLYGTWDALVRQRTNGAVVILATDAPADRDDEAAKAALRTFARALYPHLRGHLP